MLVYILAIEPPLHHARYYIGWSSYNDYRRRLQYHLDGRGCRLIAAAVEAGREIRPILVIPDVDRNFERKLKNAKSTPKLVALALRTGELYGRKVRRLRPRRNRKGDA